MVCMSIGVMCMCRHVRSVRDEDSAVYRSCTFLGDFAALALGTHSGEVRLHDTLSGDLIDTFDAHDTPVYQLRVRPLSQSNCHLKRWACHLVRAIKLSSCCAQICQLSSVV